MNTYLEHETSRYSLHSDRFGGFVLKRRSDGASQYFQGNDARLWRRNIDALVTLHNEETEGWSISKHFDYLCSGYDDVLALA